MGILAGIVVFALAAGAAAMIWQQRRYLRARRERVEDRQRLWYPARTFHVVHFLAVRDGGDVIEEVRKLRDALETSGCARVIYAGRGVANVVSSAQLPEVDWNAVVLVEYDSRAAYDAVAASETYRSVLAGFEHHHAHGMQRQRLLNLLVPQGLLALRLKQILTGESHFPLVPAPSLLPGQQEVLRKLAPLDSLRPLGEQAIAIFNLLEPGNRAQRSADRGYTQRMMGPMAERAHGPIHIGRAVAVEGDARFRMVGIVYYPGADYFRGLVGSTFMSRIGGGKQLGDSLAVLTVPILSRL